MIWGPAAPTPPPWNLPRLWAAGVEHVPLRRSPRRFAQFQADVRFFSQPEANEIFRSHKLSSQTRWRLPVHIFVLLKGIDLKEGTKQNTSNGEKLAELPRSWVPLQRLHFRGPSHFPAFALPGPIAPQSRFSRSSAPCPGSVGASAAYGGYRSPAPAGRSTRVTRSSKPLGSAFAWMGKKERRE